MRLNVASDFALNIQAALDALAGKCGELYFPAEAGPYVISAPVVQVSGNVRLVGDSPHNGGSVITTAAGIPMFDIRGGNIAVERLSIRGGVGSAGFQIGTVDYPQFRDVGFFGQSTAISLSYGHGLFVDHCWFLNHDIAISGANTTTPDMGDHVITNSEFVSQTQTGSAIRFVSSGGLKISGNKFIGWDSPIVIAPSNGVNTSDAIVTGNSIEGYGGNGIVISASGTGLWKRINITGNQLAGASGSQISLGKGASIANVVGNIIEGYHSAGIGIDVSGPFDGGLIESNTFLDVFQAVKDQSNGSHLSVGRNYYRNNSVIFEGCSETGALHTDRHLTIRTDLLGLVKSSSYVNFFRIDIPSHQSALIDLSLNGIAQGVGYVAYRCTRFAANNSRMIELVDLSPPSSAGNLVDVFFDTSGNSFILIGVRVHPGAGTEVNGALEISIRGVVQKLSKLV